MFYKTQIKSVTNYGAIDVNGRGLTFIGYLPVKAGDIVFTDGKVIFGNAPPKGSTAVFDEPSGIPILADDDLAGNELRGYFTKSGLFKKYSVAQDNWIVNDKKKFAHGEEALDGKKIIDACIAENGDEIIVTDGLFQEGTSRNSAFLVLHFEDHYSYRNSDWSAGRIALVGHFHSLKQVLGSNSYPLTRQPVNLFVNGTLTKSLDLEPFAKDIQARALLYAQEIMAQSYNELEDTPYLPPELLWYSFNRYYNQTGDVLKYDGDESMLVHPQEPFIALTVAYVQTSNITSDGKFNGTVFASTYGYCFPFVKPRIKIEVRRYDFAPPWSSLHEEQNIRHEKVFTNWNQNIGVEEGQFKLRDWVCIPFGVSCLYQISDSEKPVPLALHGLGANGVNDVVKDGNATGAIRAFKDGYYVRPFLTSTSTYQFATNAWQVQPLAIRTNGEPSKEFTDLMPVGDGFYSMDRFGRLTFYDSQQNKVAENIPVHDDFLHIEIDWNSFCMQSQDFTLLYPPEEVGGDTRFIKASFVADRQRGGYSELLNHKPNTVQFIIYTPDGKSTTMLTTARNYDDYDDLIFYDGIQRKVPLVDGYYIKNGNLLEPLQFTPLFYQLKGGGYLYGVKGGKLYRKFIDGREEIIGDGLKNFRLQELAKINKAKK